MIKHFKLKNVYSGAIYSYEVNQETKEK